MNNLKIYLLIIIIFFKCFYSDNNVTITIQTPNRLHLYEGTRDGRCVFSFSLKIEYQPYIIINDNDYGFNDARISRQKYIVNEVDGFIVAYYKTVSLPALGEEVPFTFIVTPENVNESPPYNIPLTCSTIPIQMVNYQTVTPNLIYSTEEKIYFGSIKFKGFKYPVYSLVITPGFMPSYTIQSIPISEQYEKQGGTFTYTIKFIVTPTSVNFEFYKNFNIPFSFYDQSFNVQFGPNFRINSPPTDPEPNLEYTENQASTSGFTVTYSLPYSTFQSVTNFNGGFYDSPVLGNSSLTIHMIKRSFPKFFGNELSTDNLVIKYFDQSSYSLRDIIMLNFTLNPMTSTTLSYTNSQNIARSASTNSIPYIYSTFYYPPIKNDQVIFPPPYGALKGDYKDMDMVHDILVSKYRKDIKILFCEIEYDLTFTPTLSDMTLPTITSVSIQRISPKSSKWRVFIGVQDKIPNLSGFGLVYYIIPGTNTFGNIHLANVSNIVSGDIFNCQVEFFVDSKYPEILAIQSFYISDNAGNILPISFPNDYFPNTFLNNNPISLGNFTYFTFHQSKVTFNEIPTVTYIPKGFKNTLYFNLTSRNDELPISFGFSSQLFVEQNEWFPSYWDDSIRMYRVDFEIPFNFMTQELNYFLILPSQPNFKITYSDIISFFGPSAKLIIETLNGDQMPPIVTNITTNVVSDTDSNSLVSFTISFEDLVNGFSNGEITFISEFNPIGYTEKFTSDNPFNTVKTFTFKVDGIDCRDQTFRISKLMVTDRAGRIGIYDEMAEEQIGINIFYLVDPSDITNQALVDCTGPAALISYPTMTYLHIDTQQLNPNTSFMNVEFNMTTSNFFSVFGPKPVCYLTSTFERGLQANSECLISVDKKKSECKCTIPIPYMFGYPDGVLLNIFGISDNYLNFIGYDHLVLYTIDSSNVPSTPIPSYFPPLPAILSVEPFYNNSFILSFSGRYLLGTDHFSMSLKNINDNVTIDVIEGYPTFTNSLIVLKLSSNINENFTIWIENGYGLCSYSVTPILVPNLPTPTSVPCLNSCGSVEQGKCTDQGCQCILPWFGDNCQSRVINTTTPTTNTSSPTTGQEYEGELPTGEKINLSTLISIVGIREIDLFGKVIKEFEFTKWIFTNTSSNNETKYLYSTVFKQSLGVGLPDFYTTINVTTKWYTKLENVTFADETFKIYPSTMKYSILVTPYLFKSQLSKLQLIFSASIESKSDGEICSSKQFKQSSNTEIDSQFVKLSLNSNSLYGRFIKRAVIDDRVTVIDNELIDISNSTTLEPEKSESLIAINIPNFSSYVLLDPDFSLLVDTSSNKENDDSICSSSKGLTKGQLAGIIIGSVLGFLIISIIAGFFIYKRLKYSAWYLNMKEKLNKAKENRKSQSKVEPRKRASTLKRLRRSIAPVFLGGKVSNLDKF